MAPGMENDVAIRNHDLPYICLKDVLDESPFPVMCRNRDQRSVGLPITFVTIDGEDAKDFDERLCRSPSKGWVLYVAIADVSHYGVAWQRP